jgi:hypothetical protein
MKKTIFSLFAVVVLIIGLTGVASVYGEPGISVGVVLTDTIDADGKPGPPKSSFQVGEKIFVVLSVDNMPPEGEEGADEITPAGFRERKFFLMLQFTGPDGELITADNLTGDDSPPPLSIPLLIEEPGEDPIPVMIQGEEVEVVENGWAILVDPFNAHDFYNLKVPGNYSVRAAVPLRTYPDFQIIRGKKIAELVDKNFEGFIASKSVPFKIEAIVGDYDFDGDVDRNDLNKILSYRNQPASVCPACDLDGDGTITVLDARQLIVMCTRPRCATE